MVPSELSFGAQEGFRTLRAILTARAGRKPRAYLVTGSSPGEGKTTSAIGLSAALAQSGSRVILIEADLRRPTIASALGLRPRLGTEHVMSGEASLKDALTVARFDGSPLRVLCVRTPAAKLADRLTVAVAKELIDSALAMADHVVIDSPPLTEVSDAMPLAYQTHEVIVVARVGVSRLKKLSALRNLLRQQNADPSGIVLVGEPPERNSGSYYYAHEPSRSSARAPMPNGHRAEPVEEEARVDEAHVEEADVEEADVEEADVEEAGVEEPPGEATDALTPSQRRRRNRSQRPRGDLTR
jgi:Mrp family chromosome partitioning ATPase